MLGMILRGALVLGVLGGICGIILGFELSGLPELVPRTFGAMEPLYAPEFFVQHSWWH